MNIVCFALNVKECQMEIEIIENIESELPLNVIRKNNAVNVPNTERKKIERRIVDFKTDVEASQILEDGFQEGGVNEIFREHQKRNPKLRKAAIREYGYSCVICGFNFEEVYGNLGRGFVEVHHLELLSAIKNERILTAKDVAVVCANCHRVLHRNGKQPMAIEILQKKVRERKESSSE
jgi:predicted HNH restriction endonuclease